MGDQLYKGEEHFRDVVYLFTNTAINQQINNVPEAFL